MKTIEYTYREDKDEWGPGPWQEEFDKKQWVDEATGLPCLIVRGPLGALCGYVGVDPQHPLFNVEYSRFQNWGDEAELFEINGVHQEVELDCHGGLTFSDFCAPDEKEHGICHVVEFGENDRVWWFGFDCGHMNDLVPQMEATYEKLGHKWPKELQDNPMFGKSYKPVGYVANEVANLALQLHAMRPQLILPPGTR